MADQRETANGAPLAPNSTPVTASVATQAQASPDDASQGWLPFPQVAAREVQHVVIFGGTFFTAVIALLSSAFGVVAAIAWSQAIMAWLPTVPFLHFDDPLARQFAYAGVTTLVAVVTILVLGLVNARLKTRNPLATTPTQQIAQRGSSGRAARRDDDDA